jgi:hypothetical protein
MTELTLPEDTFQRLVEKAAALRISVAGLVYLGLERLSENWVSASEPVLPQTGDRYAAELDALKRDAQSRASRYPARDEGLI